MESSDDSNNSPDMFERYSSNNNRHNRNNMEECPSVNEDVTGVMSREIKEDISRGTSRKVNFQSMSCVPRVAVQEKIIVCIENSQDKSVGYSFRDLDENSKEPNYHTIRNEAIRIFMVNKLALAKDTEFAIVSVELGKLKMLSSFTSNLNKLSKSLRDYKYVFNNESDILDITPIFSDLLKTMGIPEFANKSVIPPSHIVRVIFVNSSSFLIPHVNTNDPSYLNLIISPCFFFDVLFLHEMQSESNNVVKIYQELGKIVSPNSYLLETSRDVTTVFNSVMKLLAHPNQRVIDTVWNF